MERAKTWRGYPTLSKPLTIMGVERRWFLLSATLGLALWNAINSIVVGALIFGFSTASGFGLGSKTPTCLKSCGRPRSFAPATIPANGRRLHGPFSFGDSA